MWSNIQFTCFSTGTELKIEIFFPTSENANKRLQQVPHTFHKAKILFIIGRIHSRTSSWIKRHRPSSHSSTVVRLLITVKQNGFQRNRKEAISRRSDIGFDWSYKNDSQKNFRKLPVFPRKPKINRKLSKFQLFIFLGRPSLLCKVQDAIL